MYIDEYGQKVYSSEDLSELLYKHADLNLSGFKVEDPTEYNNSVRSTHAEFDLLEAYNKPDITIEQFDHNNQQQWFMPEEYKNFDIARWVLEQCSTEEELQRAAEELLLFQQRNLFNLLCYLKYLVDVMREHNIVWGVGRGSSTASFVLYLIGVHKINSLYYNIPITDFLK
jgi:DNA polymerase III alpha subunit